MKAVTRIAVGATLLLLLSPMSSASAADAPSKPAPDAATTSHSGNQVDGDVVIGPSYANAPELTVAADVPRGTLHEFTMNSQDSKIYPGLKGPYQRKVCVYVPSQYVAGTPAPFIVVQDGLSYKKTLPPILDTLINEHRLPAMIAILINSGGGDGRGSERGLEYDTVSDKYATFIENEVLPKIATDYKLTFTTDPEGRAAMGGSSGGACASRWAGFAPTFTGAS